LFGDRDGSFELVDRWGCGHMSTISEPLTVFRQLYNSVEYALHSAR
jgi:hypothetical protein